MSRGAFTFSLYETKELIQGKFQFRPCLSCNSSGFINVSGEGIVINVPPDDEGYAMECDECDGLCGHLRFDDDL